MLNKRNKIIILIIALILAFLFIKNQMSPQHFIEETIQSIVENEEANNINAPKDFINDIESIYTFSEKNGYRRPEFYFTSKDPVESEDKTYYSVMFLAYKYAKDGTLLDYMAFNVLIEIDRSFIKYKIVNYKVVLNDFE